MGGKIAARIGVSQSTIWCWLAGKRHPTAKLLVQLRSFLDAEAEAARWQRNQTDRACADENRDATARVALC
jgi:transcriptional regulator with XRE-family HTH domain